MTEDDEREFAAGLRRAGLVLPAERLELMKTAFLGYRELAAVLDRPLAYADEPLGLYVPPAGGGADPDRERE